MSAEENVHFEELLPCHWPDIERLFGPTEPVEAAGVCVGTLKAIRQGRI